MPRTDDLDAVVEDENPDRRAHQVVSMHQRIDQQFLKNGFRNFRQPRRIDPAPRLHLVQVAQHKGQRVIENLAQRARKILGIQIIAGMDDIARITNRLHYELRFDPLRLLGKQQHASEVQFAVVRCQIHVLQQAKALVWRLRKLPLIHITQKVAKAQLVQRLNPGFGWQFIRVELVGNLEQPAQLLLRINPSLVCTTLEPDHPVLVEIRLVKTGRNAQHDDNPPRREHDILS